VTIDTLRADHLGAYGYSRATSPALDALASQGALFKAATTHGPWTPPALFSLATGTHPYRHRVHGWGDPPVPGIPTLAETLRRAGYRTALFDNHNVFFELRSEITAGFLEVSSFSDGTHPAARVVDLATSWLENREPGPFFLWLHLFDPHEPFAAPPPYDQLFVDDGLSHFHGRVRPVSGTFGAGGIPRFVYESAGREDRLDRLVAAYDAEIRYTTDQIGRLLGVLDRLNLAKDTLVVVTADHGEILERTGTPFHGTVYFSHGTYLYQDLLSVPLIVRYPRAVPAGRIVDQPVALIDVIPTVLEAVRIDRLPTLEGRSLFPLLRGLSGVVSEPLLAEELRNNWRAVRWGRYKLIDYGPDEAAVLYDLEADPLETRDIAAERKDLVETLREKMTALSGGAATLPDAPRGQRLDEDTLRRLRALGYAQ